MDLVTKNILLCKKEKKKKAKMMGLTFLLHVYYYS